MDSSQNDYKPPAASLSPIDAPSEKDLALFVASNSEYYLKRWEPLRSGTARTAGFNWPAAFFTIQWLAYRRLYRYGFILLAVQMLLVVAVAFSGRGDRSTPFLWILFGSMVASGFAGNVLLYRRAERICREAQGQTVQIISSGGVSSEAVWIVVIGSVVIRELAIHYANTP